MPVLKSCANFIRRSSSHAKYFSRRYSDQVAGLRRTCLYDFHVAQGGKMVPFAGWEMPVQYKDSISASHHHVRNSVGIFDVSHMLQTRVDGQDGVKFIESMIVGDIEGLKSNQGTLTLFTNDNGGINDDLIVNKTDEGYLYIVSNAGCMENDYNNMKNRVEECRSQGMNVQLEIINKALIAVQGPLMTSVLQPGLDFDLKTLPFMTNREAKIFGIPDCRVTRCGYTGEDGVEISVPTNQIEDLLNTLLSSSKAEVKMIGLGARDSLRLEAGLCLYGSDIDEKTTPVEATLAWTIAKRRRAERNFPGAEKILDQLKNKPSIKRVGFISSGPPARGGTAIYDESGEKKIGHVTSGIPSPTLKTNVAMGYVDLPFSKNGTPVKFGIRKNKIDAVVSKMPFVPAKYYIPK
ncbi:aminomethyltransferase, mitochondrial [Patella vulgata]|uniref:aminomethyltransferase, mitochondrial n=1 Tax=Patella vulgata TaxID=6465 RepID=UPI00218094DE|nr:aminomethyltransferase, mitochondrial [Patella vulgata]